MTTDTQDSEPQTAEGQLTPSDKDGVLYVLGKLIHERRTDDFLDSLPAHAQEAFVRIVAIFNYACEDDVNEVRERPEFQQLLGAIAESVEAGAFTPDVLRISAWRRIQFILELARRRRDIERGLLERQAHNLRSLPPGARLRNAKRRIIERELNAVNASVRRTHGVLRDLIASTPSWLRFPLHPGVPEFLRLNRTLIPLLAYFLLFPHDSSPKARELNPAWETFPLKWVASDLVLPEIRRLLRVHGSAGDLSEYFVDRYSAGASTKFEDLKQALRGVQVLQRRAEVIAEAVAAYDLGLYNACICTALPAIEGLVWDLGHLLHYRHGGANPAEALRVGNLLRTARMREELDENFILYFCGELYPRRNPVLHGRALSAGGRPEAARKLATLEYMIRRIDHRVTTDAVAHFKETLPTEVQDQLMAFVRGGVRQVSPHRLDDD